MKVFNNSYGTNSFQSGKKDDAKVAFGPMAVGYLGGSMVYKGFSNLYNATIDNGIITSLTKIVPKPQDNIDTLLGSAFKNSGLSKYGTEFVDVSKMKDIIIRDKKGNIIIKNIQQQVADILDKETEKGFFNKLSRSNPVKYKKEIDTLAETFASGQNAVYLFNENKVLVNSEKLGFSAFHEMGHAMNRQMSKLGKTLQNMRSPFLRLPAVLLAIALLTNKRTEENPPQNKWQKFTGFVKNNVGKLSALCSVPIIAEEIMASVRGQKLAKAVLPANLLKSVTKTNALGLLSYVGAAVATGIFACCANEIRDGIVTSLHMKRVNAKQQ